MKLFVSATDFFFIENLVLDDCLKSFQSYKLRLLILILRYFFNSKVKSTLGMYGAVPADLES